MNKAPVDEHQFRGALIVGITSNMSKKLELGLLKIMDNLGAILPTTALIVVSDSSRQSQSTDMGLSNLDSRIEYLIPNQETLPSASDDSKSRVLRNVYVQAIRENPVHADYELIVVLDLEGSSMVISEPAIRVALNSAFQWDMLAANQTGKYRDIESLRHEFWSPNNSIDEFRWFRSFVNEKKAWEKAVKRRLIRISTRNPPIPVDSAFGGFCIYKRWIFEKFDYGHDGKLADSENSHVTLNRKAKADGAQLYIHPALINSNGRHLHFFQEGLTRRLKLRAHSFPFAFFVPYLRNLRTTLKGR
jgi:hypothetical protein